MVMEKPIQFTIVSDVPLESSGALLATSVENNGESAITTNPQKNKKATITIEELLNKNSGERMQHKQESNNEIAAIFFAPKCSESKPLKTQASPPDAIIPKDKSGTFICAAG